MMHLHAREIGGGVVRRRFTKDGEILLSGHRLSGDEVRALPEQNRRALIENRFLEVWPDMANLAPVVDPDAKRHLVNAGFGKFDVIEGVKLNEHSLTKEEAEALIASADHPTN